jgi:hypothetical protein
MKRYLLLVHYEFQRFRMIYFALLAITLLSQALGLVFYCYGRVDAAKQTMLREAISAVEYAKKYGFTSFFRYVSDSFWFNAPIALGITALLIYVFLIWYRDWIGKNMFIYRLLMLPTSRSHVYLAKLSLILYLVWGLVAWQLLLMPVLNEIYQRIVFADLRDTISLLDTIRYHPVLELIIPRSFVEFLMVYLLGIMGVMLVFTAILMERCYRIRGIIGGILYIAAAVLLFFLPLIVSELWLKDYFYPVEMILLEVVMGLLVIGLSYGYSTYLIRRRITV